MAYIGSWKIDDALTFPAVTHRFDTGALTNADAVPLYRVFEDETPTPIVSGAMAALGYGGTGTYSEQITLSAANGFEKGKSYTVLITATVNAITGAAYHTFQMEAEVDANTVSSKTGYSLAANQAISTVTGNVEGKVLGGGASSITGTGVRAEIATAQAISTVSGNVNGDVQGKVLGGGGSSLTATGVRAELAANQAISTVTGNVSADVISLSGDAAAADNAEAFFDGTGYAGTGNTIPTVTTVTNLTNAPTAGDLTATMKTSVKTEAVAALNTDTYAEPGQGAPAATTTLVGKIGYMYKAFRNRFTQTATEAKLYADDAATVDQKATVSDDATTFDRGEMGSGP